MNFKMIKIESSMFSMICYKTLIFFSMESVFPNSLPSLFTAIFGWMESGNIQLKFIYSEKATNFCKISTVDLSYVVMVKSTVEISQNFVAFSECMNFTRVPEFLTRNYKIGTLVHKTV
jgi:hypothetical protein